MSDDPTIPPDLELEDGDVVEAMEIVDDHDDHDDGGDGPAARDDGVHGEDTAERRSGFDGIGTRREGRERAIALLYEAEQRGAEPLAAVLDGLPLTPEPFTQELVRGVSDHLVELDAEISARSRAWPLDRMPALDRAILRLGAYELLHGDAPTGAVVSEAIELAKRYSTDDSSRFVNGLLGAIARDRDED